MEEVIRKIITKEKFEKAFKSGNYKDMSDEAKEIISKADDMDMLELTTKFGSALKVISARKLDENRFMELLIK